MEGVSVFLGLVWLKFSRVLVTGGAGFIGSHLVDALLGRGFRVGIVDNLSGGSLENIKCWFGDSRFEFVEGALSFGFGNVVFEGDVSVVGEVLVNGAVLPVGKVAAWDGENSGYYYQFVVELWLYNATSRSFGYHNRFVSLWLNMTGSP